MKLTISNWAKYNPRNDVKHPSWFRLQNTFWLSLFSFDNDEKVIWIVLLSLASQKLSAEIDLEEEMICTNLKVTPEKLQSTLNHLEAKGMIQIGTSRKRNARVTRTCRERDADVTLQTDRQTDRQTDKRRVTSWDETDPFGKVFEHLMAFPKYARIFDREADRKTVQAHMDRNGLSVADMEQVAWELRCWADGPASELVKSPRGTFATFVRNYAAKKATQPTQPAQPKITMLTGKESDDELY